MPDDEPQKKKIIDALKLYTESCTCYQELLTQHTDLPGVLEIIDFVNDKNIEVGILLQVLKRMAELGDLTERERICF